MRSAGRRRCAAAGRSWGLFEVAALLALLAPLARPCRAWPAEAGLASVTYLRYYEREFAGGGKERFAPLYEYLSADAAGLGGAPVNFHFYGWGRLDLAEASGSGKRSGEVGSAWLEYLHPRGNAQVKAGRFFLAEGVAAEILDGAFVKLTTPPGVGFSAWGGAPVEQTILDNTDTGGALYGGRIFFARAGRVEAGASYLTETGPFRGRDREQYGGDLWIRPAGPVEFSGQVAYNRATKGVARQRYAVRIVPGARFDLSAGYEAYSYEHLFQAALHPVFLGPSSAPDNADRVRAVFAVVDWEVLPGLALEVRGRHIRHDRSDPGKAVRGEAGARYTYHEGKDTAGLFAALVSADRPENEYRELRGFASWTRARWRLSADGLAQRYGQPIAGVRAAYQVVASAGCVIREPLSLSAQAVYTKSPRFEEDYAGLLRVSLDLGSARGRMR